MSPFDIKSSKHMDAILRKIKKCLALSASSEPHEAAAALRQARALMAKHGISEEGVAMSQIGEASIEIATMSRDKPAYWEGLLASVVAKAFGCQLLVSKQVLKKPGRTPLNDGEFRFIGLSHQAPVAAYTASVLIRRCRSSRQQWIKSFFEHRPGIAKSKKSHMGDLFAMGWVASIEKTVTDFAMEPAVQAAVDRYVEAQINSADTPSHAHPLTSDMADVHALQSGAAAGRGERLYRPIDGHAQSAAIEFREDH